MSLRRFASLALAPVLMLAACSSQEEPFDPAKLDSRLFNLEAVNEYRNQLDRAYVMGHATGIYLLGKTLPQYTAPKGYVYGPGLSSGQARIPYDWWEVVTKPSGGLDGRGSGLVDDVGAPLVPGSGPRKPSEDDVGGALPTPTGTDGTYNPTPGTNNPTPGTGTGTSTPTDPNNPNGGSGTGTSTPTDPLNPNGSGGTGTSTPTNPNDPNGGDDGQFDPDPRISDDCEDFLNPAGYDARDFARQIDAVEMLGKPFQGDDQAIYVKKFYEGLEHSLNIEDRREFVKFAESEYVKPTARKYGLCKYSPLVLDLAGDGIQAGRPEDGVRFDFLGTGDKVLTAWPKYDDALLAMDRDGDGMIESSRELFGKTTRHEHGFAALAALDGFAAGGNMDGVLDARDRAFTRLVLWRDENRDGISQSSELVGLASESIAELPLAFATSQATDAAGNSLRQQGQFVRTGAFGLRAPGAMVDVWFRYLP